MLQSHGQKGGAIDGQCRGARAFQSCIHDFRVFDARFQGYSFTWKKGPLEERLDQMLTNFE